MSMLTTNIQKVKITLEVNGRSYTSYIAPSITLLEFLRDELKLTGTKKGCDDANCGVCTVLVDGMAIKSCAMLIVQANGKKITTIEGLESPDGLHPLQRAFIDHFAVQCGFCTPGMILTAKAILDENPKATEDEIREGLHGNICRCTGYTQIVQAIEAVRDGDYEDVTSAVRRNKR
jgi:aerobic-type carbon monoxide dehydrogenase small subunit (CoxS/CutS family)